MRLNHNLASLNVYRQFGKITSGQSTAMERITSGLKINGAKDDPNGLAKSERLRIQLRGLNMASKNAQDGMSMLQTAEGGLDGMGSMVQRARELIVQAGNGTYSAQEKEAIQSEINEMIDGVSALAKSTDFNGVKLMADGKPYGSGQESCVETMLGSNAGEKVMIPQYDLSAGSIKCQLKDGRDVSLQDLKTGGQLDLSKGDVNSALQMVDKSLEVISDVRSRYGALENRFEESMDNLNEMSIKVEGADSDIRDADVAGEMFELSKYNLLNDAANAMMAQTNKMPQDVLRILENVRNK